MKKASVDASQREQYAAGMPDEDDEKTRVTGLEEMQVQPAGDDCLVVIHTAVQTELGRRYLLNEGVITIGRGAANQIVVSSDAVSRQHAQLERRGADFLVSDLNSTNGTFINNERQRTRNSRLNRGDQIRVGDTVFKYLSGSDIEAQYHAVIGHMAVTDGLTNLANRKHLDTLLAEEVQRAHRHNRELSVLMLDIDHFKTINDAHGHLAGDRVIAGLGHLLRQRLRSDDKLGRYGGEEFCAILPETGLDNATTIAETLRTLVATHPFPVDAKRLTVTVSIGAAALKPQMHSTDLYRAADEMLYRAKNQGRNQVCS
ncbi:MAG TPA: GGDEF domain-containing protein [Steroidobacteraceae bacterium]|nr:GGDEF domain-containing protein [Steroidobacteraceae bacterium]